VADVSSKKELADVVLIDIIEGLAQGKALDIMQSAPIEGFKVKVTGSENYSQLAGSDIVVVTAGMPRKPGMSRMDLLKTNLEIVKSCIEKIKTYAQNAIILMVTNPLDVMSYVALKVSGFERERVFGMAGVLDSARFRYFISERLKVSPEEVQTLVLGTHGDDMVPLVRYTTVRGVPLSQLLTEPEIEQLIHRTRNAGAEIVSFLKTGGAYYAPASCVCQMLEAIIKDEKKVMPASAYLQSEYEASDVYIGVPVRLGKRGIEEIIQLKLSEEESQALQKSIQSVRKGIEEIEHLI
ncbi:MAG: malate dehydrogenase, partial [Candidatus Bathyarchaeia archaeon]